MNRYVSNQRHQEWFPYAEERLKRLESEIRQEEKNHVLNVNEEEYKKYLYDKYKLMPLHLDESKVDIHQPRREERPHSNEDRFHERSPYYWVCSVACQAEGNTDLWGVIPTTSRVGGRPDFAVSGSTLTFVFNIISRNADEFNRRKDEAFGYLRDFIRYMNSDVILFNAELPNQINILFTRLKAEYIEENSFFSAINVTPNPDAPRSYAVPKIEKRPAIQKPTVTAKAFTPEPTVDAKAYSDIIDCLIRIGLSIERKPSLYVGKDEEALRDLFLVQLELAFTGGTVTGETFNRSGKTDILLKNTDGTNLFVGECKVWKGPKHYLEAISQLLEYLTWDDSKTALVVFVKSVTLSSVIQAVRQITLKHPAAVRLVDARSDRFFHFTFALPQDNQKHVALQVILFHFDKTTEGRMG